MNGKGDTPRPVNGDRFRSNFDAIDWGRGGYMTEAARRLPNEPVYPGQLPAGSAGAFTVAERCDDGSEILRQFDDEDLAMQCSLKTGLPVERNDET